MTKTFKEATDEFQKIMGEYNKKFMTTDEQILPDFYSEKNKEIEKIAKEIITNVEAECREDKRNDNIISPTHYASDKGFEVFDVQEAFIHELKGMSASYWCNIVKYILRFQRKNGVEDLKKAKYYLEKLIEKESNNE